MLVCLRLKSVRNAGRKATRTILVHPIQGLWRVYLFIFYRGSITTWINWSKFPELKDAAQSGEESREGHQLFQISTTSDAGKEPGELSKTFTNLDPDSSSEKCCSILSPNTDRLKRSFYPQAIQLLNEESHLRESTSHTDTHAQTVCNVETFKHAVLFNINHILHIKLYLHSSILPYVYYIIKCPLYFIPIYFFFVWICP